MKNTEDLQFAEVESVLTQSYIYIYIYIYHLEKILSQLLMTSKERDSMTFISSLLWTPFHFISHLPPMKSLPLAKKHFLGFWFRQDGLDLFVPTPLFVLEKRRDH